MKCPNCNKKINLKLKFCPHCGKMISKQKFKGRANSNSKESGKKFDDRIYWASKESNIFHRPSCEWAQEILDHNLIIYHSRQEAIDDGREPCHVCYP